MLNPQVASEVMRAAKANGVEPAGLLAVVEIESNGKPFEDDGVTPQLLFERHIFYRELSNRASDKLEQAVDEGLAIPKRQPKTQYKDQGSSFAKLALVASARAIDQECANRSCSWGLGQTMGFNAEELGFANATAMLAAMMAGGIAAQIDFMIKEMQVSKCLDALNQHDWAKFARIYNGSSYKDFDYDTKLANAYARWLGNEPVPAPAGSLMMGAQGDQVRTLQTALQQSGYDVGTVDGVFGSHTRDAVLAFQRDRGLQQTGVADPATLQALMATTTQGPTSGGDTTMNQDILRAVLDAALRQSGQSSGGSTSQQVLQALLAAAGAAANQPPPAKPQPTTPPPSPIDNALGGEALTGKKTMLAILAYVVMSILQSQGVVGYATGPTVEEKKAAMTTTTTQSTTQPAQTASPAPAQPTPPANPPATPAPAPAPQSASASPPGPVNGQTPTGVILTTLIAAFGGLGFLAKIDRAINALAMAAGAQK